MDLDEVFADVPRVGAVEGCTHCYSQSDLDLLGGDPALVPDSLAWSFAYEVTDHWSEQQYGLIWRGLAPRILAALAESPDERLLHGLTFAGFSTWPDTQQTALREAVRDMVTRAVTGGVAPFTVERLICAAANIDQDLRPWLAYLDTLTGADADAGLTALALHWAEQIAKQHEPMLWWGPRDPAAPIRDWLYSDVLHERLSRVEARDAQIAIAYM
ncbi:hypothetical protein [Kibdelosporangium phytohabitans]|uniref:Uncharacterized protein n=1 Tax=Kibdelosporangium phytohabitans TaxID=860235 RepID=A0A0N9I5H3_9PSEU|nr:hypothetical protein [Kibdelosporangium phytohabitans]ALG11157.1 hypothetical protein AOZ06_33555 [Kibdelosporangium phytohabitans]MBE1462411.1 hypothetical protein [Kibdelosporangium phytohabitans]